MLLPYIHPPCLGDNTRWELVEPVLKPSRVCSQDAEMYFLVQYNAVVSKDKPCLALGQE